VLDLMPEGYKLRKFKETVLKGLGEGSLEHTLTAFWEYLLLLEICHKVLDKDRAVYQYEKRLTTPYRELKELYERDDYIAEGDFSERMTALLGRISDDFAARFGTSTTTLSQQEVTELLYRHDVAILREKVVAYLRFKNEVWLLFDNIDKGWPSHGLTAADLKIIRTLLEATRKVEQHLQRKEITCRTLVFLRNDVYERLIDETPDRGKDARVALDWTDPDMLRELIRLRLVFSGMSDRPFDELWRQLFQSHIDGEESAQYLIDRCLMRPRGLIDLLTHCKAFAVNLKHDRVTAADVSKGLKAFSSDLIVDVGYEIRDLMPSAADVLYGFVGRATRMSEVDLLSRLRDANIPTGDYEAVVALLLWYGVLGISNQANEAQYIYDVQYEMPMLMTLRKRWSSEGLTYVMNPAFVPGLGTHTTG